MKVYLVGGAVRDKLLGLPIKERDWVVVGATPDEMQALGYRQVGKDFPVFLHPKTGEEYALARTERKTAPGYKGFDVHASPEVTLEEDLERRDLTVNAIAMTPDGDLVDPFGGQRDLEARVLRHVSPAFVEDPVRILRVARFAARFASLGFRVADETMALMRRMVEAGEVDALVPERVWAEMQRALGEATPSAFVRVLRDCDALAILFPEIDRLFGVPQPAEYHPEVDTGLHTLLVVDQAARLSDDPVVRFAALVHDLGKGLTPEEEWPKHHRHEKRTPKLVEAICARYRAPNAFCELGVRVGLDHGNCHRAFELRPVTLLKLLERLDAFRRPERLEQFVLACKADARGRPGHEDEPYPQGDYLLEAAKVAAAVDAKSLVAQGLRGPEIGEALREQRIDALAGFKARKKAEF